MHYVPNRTARFIRKVSYCCIPLLICSVTIAAQAQTLHALLIIMDADGDVGEAMQVNAKRMQELLTQVEKKDIGLQVETGILLSSQHQARKGDLTAWLDTRDIADEDILLVYFSGKGGFASAAEFLYLQDGGISHTEVLKKVQAAGTGRFTLLITDRCNAVFERTPDSYKFTASTRPTTAQLENLFKKHNGFLHLTSATEQEPGWATAKIGGLFTHALLRAIQSASTRDGRDSASWTEVFEDSRRMVQEAFENADLPEPMQDTLRNQGIQHQTPKAYQLPTLFETSVPAGTNELWDLENPRADFTVDLKTDKENYSIDALITLGIEITERAYVFIFSWKNDSNFVCLFPNRFEDANLLGPGKIWSIPPRGAKYEIFAEAQGTEQFKIIALRNAADRNAIQRMLLSTPPIQERIVQYLRQMKPNDWAENRTTAETRGPSSHEEDDFRNPDDDNGAHKNRSSEENNRTVPDNVDKVRHPNPVDIVFFKEGEYGAHAYLAELMDPDKQDTDKVAVHIFNAALHEKYGETLPKTWIIRGRTEPKEGWGHRSLMLSFYRNEEWIFTTDAVMHEDHYLLPERINGNGPLIQGDREAGFGDIRIPIPVTFERTRADTEK